MLTKISEPLNFENFFCLTSQTASLYLKVSALFINGDDEPVYIGNELIPLCLPQAFSALLQQLHQHLLKTHRKKNANSAPLQRQLIGGDRDHKDKRTFRVRLGISCFLLPAHADQLAFGEKECLERM